MMIDDPWTRRLRSSRATLSAVSPQLGVTGAQMADPVGPAHDPLGYRADRVVRPADATLWWCSPRRDQSQPSSVSRSRFRVQRKWVGCWIDLQVVAGRNDRGKTFITRASRTKTAEPSVRGHEKVPGGGRVRSPLVASGCPHLALQVVGVPCPTGEGVAAETHRHRREGRAIQDGEGEVGHHHGVRGDGELPGGRVSEHRIARRWSL